MKLFLKAQIKLFALLVFFIFLLSTESFAQKGLDTITTGIYLKTVNNINSSTFSYDVDLWMWFYYKNDSLNPLQTVEITNAKKYDYSNISVSNKAGTHWASQNCKATINQNWDLEHYPFDHQKLEIILEESQQDVRNLILVADKQKFKYNDNINIKGWKIDSSKSWNGISHYNSDFGDPTLNGESNYSKIHYTIFLSRKCWALFFKLFTGCYVAFLVSFLAFFIKPIYVDPRFGLSIGGLFAAVGNKYVVDANIPSSISFSLADKIHDCTFIFILFTIALSIISLKENDSIKLKKKTKFDKYAAFIVLISYILINFIFILNAF
jgi:hypothetical protein